jgi:phosphomannomutase
VSLAGSIRFGTDGWRARIAEDYTFDNVRRVAAAAASYYAEREDARDRGLVIGHDRRFGARAFAKAVAEVVAAHGVPVFMTEDATPTPVISFSVGALGAAGAINLTASHNPPTDQGFKVRDDKGAALPPEALKDLEAAIPPPGDVPRVIYADALADGRIKEFAPAPAYRRYVAGHIELSRIAQAGLRIAYDPMWGAGIGWLEWILGPAAATRLDAIHNHENPAFPEMRQPEPIPPNTDALGRHVRRTGADLGIVNDGDADRIGLYDEQGRFVNQLQVYGLLAYYLLEVKGLRGPIVKTLSTTSMLDVLGEKYGVPVHETGVGFKYVGPKMIETDAMIGGEESGGFAFRGLPERDGLMAALVLADLVLTTGNTVSELIRRLYDVVGAEWLYKRVDVRFPPDQRDAIVGRLDEAHPDDLAGQSVARVDRTDGYKYMLDDGGWILIRFSGTEPLIRVYTETTHADRVDDFLRAGLRLAGLDPAAVNS